MKCVIHIGTEKTGTTLIQRWLYENRKKLSSNGVFLSQTCGIPNNRKLCAYFQSNLDSYYVNNGIQTELDKKNFFAGFLEDFKKEIKRAENSHHTLILTSEHFSSRLQNRLDIQKFRDFISPLFSEIKIVCYLREQSQVGVSAFSTSLRVGRAESLTSFLSRVSPKNLYYDYLEILDRWSEAFGKDNIEAVLYDREKFKDQDIRRDFVSRVHDISEVDDFDFSLNSSNEAISQLQGFLIRVLNWKLGRYGSDGKVNQKRNKMVEAILANSALKIGKYTAADAPEIYDKFSSKNQELFEEYFGSSQNLFPKPDNFSLQEIIELDSREIANLEDEIFNVLSWIIDRSAYEEAQISVPIDQRMTDLFRDVALTYETGKSITKGQAVELMKLARNGRPKGQLILDFLKRNGTPEP